jgi:hypothetical protein
MEKYAEIFSRARVLKFIFYKPQTLTSNLKVEFTFLEVQAPPPQKNKF